MKGEGVIIRIREEEHKQGLNRCKNNVHVKVTFLKGENLLTHVDICSKLESLWKP